MPEYSWPVINNEEHTITYELPASFDCLGLRTVVLQLDPEGDNYHEVDHVISREQLLSNLAFILDCTRKRERFHADGTWPPALQCHVFIREHIDSHNLSLHLLGSVTQLSYDYPSDSDDEHEENDWREVTKSNDVCNRELSNDDVSKILRERFTDAAQCRIVFNCRKSKIEQLRLYLAARC